MLPWKSNQTARAKKLLKGTELELKVIIVGNHSEESFGEGLRTLTGENKKDPIQQHFHAVTES